jgi:DUF1009 family protein
MRVYAAALLKEADPILEEWVDDLVWLHLGQVKRLIRFFKKSGIKEAVMMGAVRKTRMFRDVRPDMQAISIMANMRHTHDDGVLRAFADYLEKNDIRIKSSTFLLPDLIAPKGCWTKRKPSRSEKADMQLGWRIAKEIGRLDIGQCVVVGGGSVLAVEAIDGTDATIQRGGRLGQGNAVVVKACKPIQDERFDIPAVGLETIQTMKVAGVNLLAVEAGKALVFDREEMIVSADESGICIVAVDASL